MTGIARRVLLGGFAAAAAMPASGQEDQRLDGRFTSGGTTISVELFRAGPRSPAVLLLHGADGLVYADRYRLAAGLIAANGITVALPHYLDRTGEKRVTYATLRERYPLWRETVRDAIGWLGGRPEADPARLGIVGISLGGALALSCASVDRRVRAVVEYSAPVPEDLGGSAALLPPTLILHGDQDRIVPSRHAADLDRLLSAAGIAHEMRIYPGEGHVLAGAAQLDAASRALAFFRTHLG